jgi:heterotetrameric sarcosine oxidase gamma subunit
MADATRIALRTAAPARLGDALGLVLGGEINRAVASGERTALRLGPDEWLILAPAGEAAALMSAGMGLPASLVDVSDRSVTRLVEGLHASAILNAFVALDLNLAAFPIGMCTRTLLGKAEVVLWRTAQASFRLEVGRSFAPYVAGCLEEAGREFA